MDSRKSKIVILALVMLLGALWGANPAVAQIGPGPFAYFPSASTTDGRFLGFSCPGTATFEQNVTFGLAVPADSADFTISLFDGDTGKLDGASKRHWDLGTRQIIVSLYADPLRQLDTSPANLVGTWKGNDPNALSGPSWVASSTTMPDNDWWGVTISTAALAQAPSGNFFYTLVVGLDGACTTGEALESNIKIAASNPMAFLVPRFGLVAPLRQVVNDAQIIYPGLVSIPPPGNDYFALPTTYDGTFEFFFNLPPGETDLRLFDGDFDLGPTSLTSNPSGTILTPCPDMDDPDTPADYSGFPFSTTGVTPEGAMGPGSPPDDNVFDIFRRGEPGSPRRIGCVRYEVIDPQGTVYRNDNPSGGFEWEQFRIASALAFDPSNSDYVAASDTLPAGIWKTRLVGLDMSNLNFFYADACSTRIEAGANSPACPVVSVYLLGQSVFLDTNGNGMQDADESGIPDVLLKVTRDSDGLEIGTAGTGDPAAPNWAACVAQSPGVDTSGLYCFGVDDSGDYTIEVAPENFLPGGPLYGYGPTNGNVLSDTLLDGNVFTYNFGYRGTGSIGGRLWNDIDGDGVQDGGEPSFNSLTLQLLDENGTVIATTTTSGDGNYLFSHLGPGDYTLRVVSATQLAGFVPTYDPNGIGTPGTTTVSLAPGENLTDMDFGYRVPPASVGDRVWNDLDGDGSQGMGEAGLNGVTVELLDAGFAVIATTVTSGDGNYTFSNITPGTYTVRVASGTLPAGFTATYDLGGTGTPHTTTLSLTSGENRIDADFGYRAVPPSNPGTGTIGYWKNHAEAWPVQQITVGGVTYTKAQAIVLMGKPGKGDKTYDLFKQLVAAKLNVIIGNDSSCISATITSADNWLVANPVGSNVKSSNSAWATGGPLHQKLDDYNNGRLCAPHRG